jgi:hypothetical protein
MTTGLRLILLIFALVGFAGTGASLAIARQRQLSEGERDLGMVGIAAMLFVFAALCTTVGAGLSGVFAFGGVVMWASYVITAERIGMFRVSAAGVEEHTPAEPRQTT